MEGLLGLRRHGAAFTVKPSIPAMWPKFSIQWSVGATRYRIVVLNPGHRCTGVRSAELDGAAVDPDAIPLLEDGRTHDVVVELGEPGSRAASSPVEETAASTPR